MIHPLTCYQNIILSWIQELSLLKETYCWMMFTDADESET